MTDTVNESFAWPVNSSGEIVVSSGAGDGTVVAYLPTSMVPIGATGGLALRLPVVASAEVSATPLTLLNGWGQSAGEVAAHTYKNAGIVSVYLSVFGESATESTIAILPVGSRPTATVYGHIYGQVLDVDASVSVSISPAGVVAPTLATYTTISMLSGTVNFLAAAPAAE